MTKSEFMEQLDAARDLIDKQRSLFAEREQLVDEVIIEHKRKTREVNSPVDISLGKSVAIGVVAGIIYIMFLGFFWHEGTWIGDIISNLADYLSDDFIILGMPIIVGIISASIYLEIRHKKSKKNAQIIAQQRWDITKWFIEKDQRYIELTQEIELLSEEISVAMQGTLSSKYCFWPVINTITEYFNDNRAENLADAVNKYVSEYGKPDGKKELNRNQKGKEETEYIELRNQYRGSGSFVALFPSNNF